LIRQKIWMNKVQFFKVQWCTDWKQTVKFKYMLTSVVTKLLVPPQSSESTLYG
jgi:hypothetical protein